jgi:hypothetical protein
MFCHVNDMRAVLRHRRDEQAELLIAEHVGEGHLRAAEHVAAARHAERDRRPALEEQLLELALLLLVVGTSVCISGAWKSTIGPAIRSRPTRPW